MDEMGSEESFQDVPVIKVPMTSEESLLRRLGEVHRFAANITAELQKSKPCKGVISREMMERELGALNRDRECIEKKLGLLLSSFAVAPKDGSYQHEHGSSPPDIAPVTLCNISSSVRVGQGPERDIKRPPASVECSRTGDLNGARAPLARKCDGFSSGHAIDASPSSSAPAYNGDMVGPLGGGGGRGREVFPWQGSGRREDAPSAQRETILGVNPDQLQRHPRPGEQRLDRPRWAVMGSRSGGREDRQYPVGAGEPIQAVGATPPPEDFFGRGSNEGQFHHGMSDGVFHGRRRREAQMAERGASRTINRQEQGQAGSSNGDRRGMFRAPQIASLIRSNHGQQRPRPAHDAAPARASSLRGTPHQFEANYSSRGNGDHDGLARERDQRFRRRPFRPHEDPVGTSSRNWHAAPLVWPVEGVGSEVGTRAAYGGAHVSIPVAMTVDNHHIDRRHPDSHQSGYRQHNGNTRHVDTRRVHGSHLGDPSDHPDMKRLANDNRYSKGNNNNNKRHMDSVNNDLKWPYDDNGSRAGDTRIHADSQAYCDHNGNLDHYSRHTSRRYNNVESRGGKRPRWYQPGQEPEREQRSFQAGTPRYSPRLAGGVAASNESSAWARGKLDAYGLMEPSPTH